MLLERVFRTSCFVIFDELHLFQPIARLDLEQKYDILYIMIYIYIHIIFLIHIYIYVFLPGLQGMVFSELRFMMTFQKVWISLGV